MNWILEGLVTIVFGLVRLLINFFTLFYKSVPVGFNIGDSVYGSGAKAGFETIIGVNFADFNLAIQVISATFIVVLFFFYITRVGASPSLNDDTPVGIVGGFIFAMVGVIAIQPLIWLMEHPLQRMLKGINSIGNSMKSVTDDTLKTSLDKSKDSIQSQLDKGAMDDFGLGFAIFIKIILIVLLIFLAFTFIQFIFELVERYCVLGVLFYFSPMICIALVSKKTRDVFWSFWRMFSCQALLLLSGNIFLFVFVKGLDLVNKMNTQLMEDMSSGGASAVNDVTYNSATGGWAVAEGAVTDPADFTKTLAAIMCGVLVLTSWLKVGQRFDQYLSRLGLNVAQSGGGMLGAAFAVGTAMKNIAGATMGAVGKGGMGAAGKGGRIAEAYVKGEANPDKKDGFISKMMQDKAAQRGAFNKEYKKDEEATAKDFKDFKNQKVENNIPNRQRDNQAQYDAKNEGFAKQPADLNKTWTKEKTPLKERSGNYKNLEAEKDKAHADYYKNLNAERDKAYTDFKKQGKNLQSQVKDRQASFKKNAYNNFKTDNSKNNTSSAPSSFKNNTGSLKNNTPSDTPSAPSYKQPPKNIKNIKNDSER
jgi:hypothetical protein